MSLLENILDSTKGINNTEKLMLSFFAGSAVSLTFLPHFANLSRQANTMSLAGGIFSACSYLALVSDRKNKEKIYGALEAAKLLSIKESLADQLAQESIERSVHSKQRLRDYVLSLPVEEQGVYIEKYELQGLIPSQYEPEAEYDAIMQIPTVAPQLPFDEVYSSRTEIDYSWLNDEFFMQPQIMVGVMQSGKTQLMALVAKYMVTKHPEGEVRIGDIHYDPNKPRWLLGLPEKELLRSYLVDDIDSIVELFFYAEKVLDGRIENKQQGAAPLKIICDEFVGVMDSLDKKLKERIIGIIKKVNFQGRKYNVSFCLGLHSTKKEETGLDSAVISNFAQLWLKDSIDDVTVAFSRSFNFDELIEERDNLRRELKQGEGYPAVLKLRGEKPKIVVLPHIHNEDLQVKYEAPAPKETPTPKSEEPPQGKPPEIKIEKTKTDPINLLLQWYSGYSTPPLDSAIKEKWHSLTGEWLTDNALQLVKEKFNELKE